MAHTEYLAINVLNEQQIVSYRLLSRALKVHSNLAKQMLYDFHHKQNAKKPGTVHATYLIAGSRRIEAERQTNGVHSQEDGEDTVMQSSPPLPSSSIPRPDEEAAPRFVRSVMLVKEEQLGDAKTLFDSISSIHLYSLEANSPSDVQTLTECNRKVVADYASEDPLEAWRQYGTIQNPNAKRRTRRTALPPPAPVAQNAEVKTKPLAPTAKPKEEGKSHTKQFPAKPTAEPEKKVTAKPAATKRQNSDIFKSFAKSRTKSKEESQSSAEASPAPATEDEPMGGFSEDEADDDALLGAETDAKAPAGKSKQEREAELKAMMDAEDEEMEDAPTPAEESEQQEGAIDAADAEKDEDPKDVVSVENGRRRGRRRVMKKKTVKDEEGYLVTKEEAAWESFSEDEPAPKKIKVPPAATINAGSKTAAKKGGKPQGNIMSFFSKK